MLQLALREWKTSGLSRTSVNKNNLLLTDADAGIFVSSAYPFERQSHLLLTVEPSFKYRTRQKQDLAHTERKSGEEQIFIAWKNRNTAAKTPGLTYYCFRNLW